MLRMSSGPPRDSSQTSRTSPSSAYVRTAGTEGPTRERPARTRVEAVGKLQSVGSHQVLVLMISCVGPSPVIVPRFMTIARSQARARTADRESPSAS